MYRSQPKKIHHRRKPNINPAAAAVMGAHSAPVQTGTVKQGTISGAEIFSS